MHWLKAQEHWKGNCPPYRTEILLKNGVNPNKNKTKKAIVFKDEVELQDIVERHDLSKFSHTEVLGYALMFNENLPTIPKSLNRLKQLSWKKGLFVCFVGFTVAPTVFQSYGDVQLLLVEEDTRCLSVPYFITKGPPGRTTDLPQASLAHHYSKNDTHPKHYYFVTSEKSKHIIELAPDKCELILIESIFDMLAARGERDMKFDSEFSVWKWLQIDDKYFHRYSQVDMLFVKGKLELFGKKICALVERGLD